MKILGIIPARYASTRFPGKPLTLIGDKSMIHRVYLQAKNCAALSDVVVATDDQRIVEHVRSFGGQVILTSALLNSGTERCAAVAEALSAKKTEQLPFLIVNIQGDEPFIHPDQISKVISCFTDDSIGIATLAKKIADPAELFNPNVVKVILDKNHKAIFFSRNVLPHIRGIQEDKWITLFPFLKHIGVYAYRTNILLEIVKLQPSPLETAESLEQLRWVENGYPISVALTDKESIAIDSPEDLSKLKHIPF